MVLEHLHGPRFMQLLPLMHFLRDVTAPHGWQRPPLRAAFMFDDPNLHLPSYGFFSYANVAKRALRDRFHVSLALVPLDAWSPHAATVQLMKTRHEQLSLVVHGNDHTRHEMARNWPASRYDMALAQCVQRMRRFETATGLHVGRVMVPPHEAVLDRVLERLAPFGFEAACLSPWSLRRFNPGQVRPASFGLLPADTAANGLPVLGRDRLDEDCESAAVINAWLGRPVVLVGHHALLARGLEVLSSVATKVNALGDVQWQPVTSMLSKNLLSWRDGATLHVQPHAMQVQLHVPESVSRLIVHAPPSISGAAALGYTISGTALGPNGQKTMVAQGQTLSVRGGQALVVSAVSAATVDLRTIAPRRTSMRALGRRLLCEARDRLTAIARPARTDPGDY